MPRATPRGGDGDALLYLLLALVDGPLEKESHQRTPPTANASWLAGVQRSSDPGSPWQRGSGATLSAAITLSLGSVFVGAEIRSLSAFNGTFLNQQVGRALYAGPNMLWKVNETVSANLAVTPQVNGHARGRPDRTVDLDNFERSQVRARVAFSF